MKALDEVLELVLALGGPRMAVVSADPLGTVLSRAGEVEDAVAKRAVSGEVPSGITVTPLERGDGQRLGFLVSWSDVAPVPAVVKAISALFIQHLERAQLKHELERADRLAMAGQLSAGLAHELGTPLTVVTGRARQIAAGTIAPDQIAETARTIAEQSERMAGIIRQVLDYARRRGPRPGRFDVRAVMRQCVSLLEQLATKKGVRLAFADPGSPVVLSFDGSQIMQVITNLVANAIAATSAGGSIDLKVLPSAERVPPLASGLSKGPFAGLVVADTGHGVAPENLARVFDPFFTTKGTGEGTGLGLSVATSIVRDHGGWIGVESTRGVGTVFTVYLPA